EKNILRQHMDLDSVRMLKPRLTLPEILAVMDRVPQIQVAPQVDEYILALVQATRKLPTIEVGVSPRGALALRKACQAHALLQNREYVTPDDVKELAVAVLAHRLIFSTDQISSTQNEADHIIETLLKTTAVPL